MHWWLLLAGVVVGGGVGDSFIGALFGGLLGLLLGLSMRLNALAKDNSALRQELQNFVERYEREYKAISERLSGVEPSKPRPQPSAKSEVQPPAEVTSPPKAGIFEPPLAAKQPAAPMAIETAPELLIKSDTGLPAEEIDEVRESSEPPVESGISEPETATGPHAPSLIERGISIARNWLLGGNTVLRVGVVLLFLGLAFLLRYASERIVVPIELRYASVAASAIALLSIGWWLRRRKRSYGLMLQGTGIAVLYLTVFAAMRLHLLLEPKTALSLLVLVTICSAVLAVGQNALGLAAAAALGGFAAPILTSTAAGDHVALFSYFTLLNAGILVIAWFKAWRLLNLIGFVGTFSIGTTWGLRSYTPELFWSTEPFLVVFFLMYVAIGLLFTRVKLHAAADAPQVRIELLRWSASRTDYLDATAVFGPPLIGFGLQYAVIEHLEFGPAFSALALGLFYILLARLLVTRTQQRALLLVETCLALGVVFGTLAIPLGLDARWTSAAWAVEGAGIYWIGLRQDRTLARAFALLLQAGAALAFLGSLKPGLDTLLEGSTLGALLLGVALLFSYLQLRGAPDEAVTTWERRLTPWLSIAGLVFLYLIAPLLFGAEGTAISWALAGAATLKAGLRLQSRAFLFSALAVQLLGGAVFVLQLDSGGDISVLASGWRGLIVSSLVGLALIGGVIYASRDPLVLDNVLLQRGMSLVLLVGLVFVNLAALFVLPWRMAGAVWAGSALLILWIALQLQHRLSFMFALVLQLVAGASFVSAISSGSAWLDSTGLQPLAHAGFWTPAILALAALAGAWLLDWSIRHDPDIAPALNLTLLAELLTIWGTSWWAFAAVSEVLRFVALPMQPAAMLLVAAASAGLWGWVALRLQWRVLALLSLLLAPAGVLTLLHAYHGHYHPAANLGWLGWGSLFAVHLLSLKRLDPLLPSLPRSVAHMLGCWLFLGVLALELRYLLLLLSEHYNAWRWLGWAILPSAYLFWISRRPKLPWPIAAYGREYRVWAALPLAMLMLAWFWLANLYSDGAADPLPYIPLLNPLELGLLFTLLSVALWAQQAGSKLGYAKHVVSFAVLGVTGLSLFALASAAVGRTVHHWSGVHFQIGSLLQSMQVQAGLSLVWTSIALGLMISGHRRGWRELWLIGAALVAVVVAKLFFVELSNRGGLERIVSFIGVGVLLLVVGYFAPLPPRKSQTQETESS